MTVPAHRTCATMPVHRRMLDGTPGYAAARDAVENRAHEYRIAPTLRQRTGTTTVPVVVHVVAATPEQDISDQQIASQFEALNADYAATNADLADVPPVWSDVVGNPRVKFVLATTDPDGNATGGVVRVATQETSFGSDDGVKSAATGGSDAWPSDRYLNLWVCALGESLLGYAQFPGGPPETDGVVILHAAFGTTGTAEAPFDKGRTATHEIGHWLNLFHIWGDDGEGCNGSDYVDDTPNQGGNNTGLPTFPSVSCENGPDGDMFVNYMDYTDDAGMFMFTAGQVERIQATLDGERSSIGQAGEPAATAP